jgi:hypothetical protein
MAVLSRHQTASGGIAATQALHSVSSAATQQVCPWMLALGGPCLVTGRVGTSGGPASPQARMAHHRDSRLAGAIGCANRRATPVHAPSPAGLHGASFWQFSAAQVAYALGGLRDVLPLEASRRAVTRQGPPSASSQGVVFACQTAARCSGEAHRPALGVYGDARCASSTAEPSGDRFSVGDLMRRFGWVSNTRGEGRVA